MAYENIPGVKGSFLDGAFKLNTASTQPKILFLGTATSGKTYEVFNVASVGEAEKEFGADTELLKGVHEALGQGADNIAVMRIGGRQGKVVITDSDAGTLTITPEFRDNEILASYTLILESDVSGEQRVLLYDLEEEEFVYDSEELEVINDEAFRVILSGFDDWTCGDIADPAGSPALSDLVIGSFTSTVSLTPPTITSVAKTAGDDGTNMSLVERYAALNQGYHLLDYRDADLVVPCSVNIDDANQADGVAVEFSAGVPTKGTAEDVLGWLWQFIYQGKLYTYFLDTQNPAAVGSNSLTHADLTGDVVPAVVTTRFAAAQSNEVRECNFGHQLASFIDTASMNWKAMLGMISTKGPAAYDRISVGEWAGVLPHYTVVGTDLSVDTAGDNGAGLLGIKFLAGKSAYRDEMVTDGNASDGLAYGGFIMTNGASLPNGAAYAYGVDDTDEAKDAGDKPYDIGRNIIVCYDHPKHRNSFNGGSTYRGNLPAAVAAKLAITPANREPIGDGGVLLKVTSPPRIHATVMNDLAKIRLCGLRREDGVGFIITSIKTAAHPDSDYSRVSTIRCVNRELQGIREIAKRYLGTEFSSVKLLSLQTAIDGFLLAERVAGFNQGAKASISFSRTDKILGRLKVRLRMVPPFSIETIDVEVALAADESEL